MASAPIVLKAGDPAPDSALLNSAGDSVHLSDYWKKQPVVLVFLRHFGCTFCRQHVASLRKDYELFQNVKAQVICVGMGNSNVGRAFELLMDLKFPVLVTGETNAAYQDYGLGKGSAGQIFGFNVFLKGLKATFQGNMGTSVQGDPYQMPGVFIVDQTGTLKYVHYYDDIADTPKNMELITALTLD